jgi:hypothetical protein
MQEKKSVFVEVFGWIMIAFSTGALILTILENFLMNIVFNDDDLAPIIHDFTISFIVYSFIILCALIISIAFLKRKEWGRIGLIMLFVFIIIFINVVLIGLWLFDDPNHSYFFLEYFEDLLAIISAGITIFMIGFSVLLVWLIIKLSSKKIAAEFKVNKLEKVQPTKNDLAVNDNEENQNQDEDNQIWLYNGVG